MNGSAYPRYARYKDSGVEWLGEIPGDWKIRRLKTIADVQLSNVDKKTVEGERAVCLCNYVHVYKNECITTDLSFMDATASDAQIRRFGLRYGDVLITKDSETPDDIAVAAWVSVDLPNVVCGYHLALVRPRPVEVDGQYLARAFGALGLREQFHTAALGITRFGLGGDAIASSVFCLPSLREQRAIADFLGRETARIDALIAKQERLIELLEEKRKAMISRAVTQGLNPKVKMKESGVVWLGKIPEHWAVERLKFSLCSIEQGWSPQCESRPVEGDEWGVLKVGCVNGGAFTAVENKALPGDVQPPFGLQIRDGDILVSRANTRELAGGCCLVQEPPGRLLLCDKLYRLTLREGVLRPKFLVYTMGSRLVRYQIEVNTSGASASMQNISQGVVRNLVIAFPGIEEQDELVCMLQSELHRIETVVRKVRQLIDTLLEKRTTLISAAVTGKIKVGG